MPPAAALSPPPPAAATAAPPPARGRDAGRRPRPREAAVLVLAPAALALAVGLWGLDREGTMWRDESTTYQVAHRDLPAIWRMLGSADAVHGLYYLLMHAVFGLWEGGLTALRLPSVLAVAAAASCVALTGRRVAGPRAGLAAGLVFPLLPQVQKYAQEGRSYALVCALVAGSTLVLVRAWSRPRPRAWAGYGALMLAACLLHEFAVLALLAHGVTLLRAGAGRRVLRGWAPAAAGVLAGLLPLAVVSQTQSGQVSWISGPAPLPLLSFAALALIGAAGAASPRVRPPGPVGPCALAVPLVVLPTAALLAASALQSLYVDRYVLYSYTGLAVLFGAGADRAADAVRRNGWRARVLAGTLALAAAAGLLWQSAALRTPESRKDDVTSAADAVRALARPGDGVLFTPGRRREPAMSYPDAFRGLVDVALADDAVAAGTLHPVEAPAARIRARMLAVPRLVVVSDPAGAPQEDTAVERTKRAVLQRHFERCASTPVRGLLITLYARPGACADRP